MIRFQCQSCHQTIKIEEKYADRPIRCPRCTCVIKVSDRLPADPSGEESLSVDSAGKSSSPILIKFRCKSCHQKIRIDAQYADNKVYCPRCKKANTVSFSQVPVPSKSKQPSASDDHIVIHFRSPRKLRRDGDPVDTLERELLDLPDPTPETAPVSISASNPTTNLKTRRVPAPESETHPGPLPQELFDKYKSKHSSRIKTGIKLLVIIGFAGGVTYGVIQWQHNRSNQAPLQQSRESESIQAGVKQTESYSFSKPKGNIEERAVAPKTDPPDKTNQLAYIQSLSTFADAAATLRSGIETGIELSDFISRTIALSQAYRDINVSPEIRLYLDIDLTTLVNQFDESATNILPANYAATETRNRKIPDGDEAGYQLYKAAQQVKELAYAVTQHWNSKKKVSLQNAEIATVSHTGTNPNGVPQLQRLLQQIKIYETKYKKYME